jgi:rSAM/selenodomain-associated transferase 2
MPIAEPSVSIIIPTLNEESCLPQCLASIVANTIFPKEILVVDADSSDRTPEIAREHSAVSLLTAPKGRAVQMNHGAEIATGEILWFVHADSIVPPTAVSEISTCIRQQSAVAGAFSFRLDAEGRRFRIVEWGVDVRSKRFGMPYGDQAIFVRKTAFLEAGGYPEVPILEDLKLWRELRTRGKTVILPTEVITSARKWEERGVVRMTITNWLVVQLHRLGISAAQVHAFRER